MAQKEKQFAAKGGIVQERTIESGVPRHHICVGRAEIGAAWSKHADEGRPLPALIAAILV
ncbi:hypothetical protein AS156_35210 [Bradyrhizobium macuxiense]|uniref:Uncharacterized protein n=1 Tax=Bradyrhizobium macuxiense TaxID=1755647 RepID=A0A109JZU5_9BRAD|nr:hypothetical protein AS156_35210 [Bradyrhizobium macuxiense]